MKYSAALFMVMIMFLKGSQRAFSQSVTILDEVSREPVENVTLFNMTRNIATFSGPDGIANIIIFKDNDSIIFQHPSLNAAVFLKKDLSDNQQIYLPKQIIRIDEYVISAPKTTENTGDILYMAFVPDAVDLSGNFSPSSADLLLSTGNITVQKSQGGGGSPDIRALRRKRSDDDVNKS